MLTLKFEFKVRSDSKVRAAVVQPLMGVLLRLETESDEECEWMLTAFLVQSNPGGIPSQNPRRSRVQTLSSDQRAYFVDVPGRTALVRRNQ